MSLAPQPQMYWTKVPTRQYDPNLSKSYVTGSRLAISAASGYSQSTYIPTFNCSLTKMGIHVSTYTDGDFWHLSGSGWQLCDTVYTKSSVPESFVFDIGQNVTSGSVIVLNFYNSTAVAKTVWVDYYLIR